MDERDMEKEGQNGKRKGWGIEKKVSFLFLDKTVSRNLKARRANKALLLKKLVIKCLICTLRFSFLSFISLGFFVANYCDSIVTYCFYIKCKVIYYEL
jgi:hypothetical protein